MGKLLKKYVEERTQRAITAGDVLNNFVGYRAFHNVLRDYKNLL